jgi:hypothetical protein
MTLTHLILNSTKQTERGLYQSFSRIQKVIGDLYRLPNTEQMIIKALINGADLSVLILEPLASSAIQLPATIDEEIVE